MKIKNYLIIGGEVDELVDFVKSIKDLKIDYYFINSKIDELKIKLKLIECDYRLICSTGDEIIEQTEGVSFNAVLFMAQNHKILNINELDLSRFILDYSQCVLKSMEFLKVLIRGKNKIKNASILFILKNENIGIYYSLNNSIKVLVEYASVELKNVVSKVDYIFWDYKSWSVTRDLISLLDSNITLFNRKLN